MDGVVPKGLLCSKERHFHFWQGAGAPAGRPHMSRWLASLTSEGAVAAAELVEALRGLSVRAEIKISPEVGESAVVDELTVDAAIASRSVVVTLNGTFLVWKTGSAGIGVDAERALLLGLHTTPTAQRDGYDVDVVATYLEATGGNVRLLSGIVTQHLVRAMHVATESGLAEEVLAAYTSLGNIFDAPETASRPRAVVAPATIEKPVPPMHRSPSGFLVGVTIVFVAAAGTLAFLLH